MEPQHVIEGLAELGFSQYEARAYVGLVGQEPLTGYALANRTGVPQPKVYETLRRLEEKRAVVRTGSDPARFVAVPPEQLMSAIDEQYRRRLDDVRTGLEQLTPARTDGMRVFDTPRTWEAVRDRAVSLLAAAQRHVYLSGHADQLEQLADAILAADGRGVRCDVLCFGTSPVRLTHGRVLEHGSTQGVVYRHHQARQLAAVVDSTSVLWALAAEGHDWDAMTGQDALLAAVVKGYVRHDIYVQQIFADFPDELVARYGPSLEDLVMPPPAGAPESGDAEQPAPPARRRVSRRGGTLPRTA